MPGSVPSRRGVRKICPTCEFTWVDFHSKNECPKCCATLTPSFKSRKAQREHEERVNNLLKNRTGKSAQESLAAPSALGNQSEPIQAATDLEVLRKPALRTGVRGSAKTASTGPGKGVRRNCPTCAFCWTDFHRKNECPKCFSPLVPVTRNLKKLMEHEEMHKMSHLRCEENKPCEEDAHEASLEVEQARMARVVIEDTKVPQDAKECDGVGIGATTPTPTRRSNAPVVLMPEPVKHEPPPGKGIRKSCHTCAFSWTDFHRKNECPKCFSPLVPKTRNLKTLTQFSGQGSAVATIKGHGRYNSGDGNEYANDSPSVSMDAAHSENVIGDSTAGSTPRWMPQDQSWSFSSLDMELDPSSTLGADAVRREVFKVPCRTARPQISVAVDTSEAQSSPVASVRSFGSGRRVKFALPAEDVLEKMQPHHPPSPATRPARSALKGGEHQQQVNNLQFIGNILFMDTGDLAKSSGKPRKHRAEGSDDDPVRFSCTSCSFSWLGQEGGTAHCPKCWQPLFSADMRHEVTKKGVPLAS